jgi:hypothetical protein
MLRKTLISAALLLASSGAWARDGYISGHVINVEPSITISVGGHRHQNGYRVLYETGGERYWTHSDYRPHDVIYVPRPVYVQPVQNYYYRGDNGHHGGWGDNGHHNGWGDYREDHHERRGNDRRHHDDDDDD